MTTVGLQALSGLLWREREALERLLCRLEGPQEDLDDIGSVATARHRLSVLEVERSIACRNVAQNLGLPGEAPTLSELVEAAPVGWAAILIGHRRALQTLAERVERADVVVLHEPSTPAGDAPAPDIQRSLVDFLS